MRRLVSIASSSTVMTASCALRTVALARRQEQVLGELLGDRRAAGDDAPLLLVLLQRALDAVPVEALVVDELGVLGGDDRALQRRRDAPVVDPLVAQPRLGVLRLRLVHPLRHERRLAGGWSRHQPMCAGDPDQPQQRQPRDAARPARRRRDPASADDRESAARRFGVTVRCGSRQAGERAQQREHVRGARAARRARGRSSRPPARSACRGRRPSAPRRPRRASSQERRGLVGQRVDEVVGEGRRREDRDRPGRGTERPIEPSP